MTPIDAEIYRGAGSLNNRAVWSWMFFDWAVQPYQVILLAFVFSRYFVAEIAPDPQTGQIMWGWMLAIVGIVMAVLSPILGAIADYSGSRKTWIGVFSIFAVLGAAMLWTATPDSSATMVLFYFALAFIGVEFATVFNNAIMPSLVKRDQLGQLSGSGWALGYVGGFLCFLIVAESSL